MRISFFRGRTHEQKNTHIDRFCSFEIRVKFEPKNAHIRIIQFSNSNRNQWIVKKK